MNKRLVLTFSKSLVGKPVVYHLVKDFNLEINILKASITPEEEGVLAVTLIGEEENFSKAMQYLKDLGVELDALEKEVLRNDTKCTSCGTCLSVCPAGALFMDKKTYEIIFDKEKCIACELCIKTCPTRAMEMDL